MPKKPKKSKEKKLRKTKKERPKKRKKSKEKKTVKDEKNKVGRKLFNGKVEGDVVQKLEEAFAYGCTDEEACVYADISRTALHNYQKKNKEFLNRKELLKQSPILLARQTVVTGIQIDPDLALKFLERKKKDEFSPKLIVEDNGQAELEELRNDLKTLIGGKNAKAKQKAKRPDKKRA